MTIELSSAASISSPALPGAVVREEIARAVRLEVRVERNAIAKRERQSRVAVRPTLIPRLHEGWQALRRSSQGRAGIRQRASKLASSGIGAALPSALAFSTGCATTIPATSPRSWSESGSSVPMLRICLGRKLDDSPSPPQPFLHSSIARAKPCRAPRIVASGTQ